MLKLSGGAIVPGVSRARSVAGSVDFPGKVDTVIVGGGIIACMAALHLAEKGISVAICEKGVIGGEASCRAAGIIEYQHLAPVKIELITRSIKLWQDINNRIDCDIGLSDRGVLTLFDNDNQVNEAKSWLLSIKGLPGVDASILSSNDVLQYYPGLGTGWVGGLLQSNALSIEPTLAASVIADEAALKGAKIFQNCAVLQIEQDAGKISSVITEKGKIKTSNVVIAGGVWSSMLLKQLGIELPQLMIFAEMLSVQPMEDGPDIPFFTPMGIVRREPDNGYQFGCNSGVVPVTKSLIKYLPKLVSMSAGISQGLSLAFNIKTFFHPLSGNAYTRSNDKSPYELNRIFQPEFVGASAQETFDSICNRIPAFNRCKIRERYAGALMSTIDNLGVISPVKSVPGLYLGTGILYGITMSAVVGEAIADMITGDKPKVDLSPYRYERFTDGSALEFHA